MNPILTDWPVDDEVWFTDDPHTIRYFTQGQCNALAWEIYKLTGWQIGMLSDEPAGNPDYAGHLFVVDHNGFAVDIRGRMSMENFRDFWPTLWHVHMFEKIEDFELEMMLWENDIHYTMDADARDWAFYIVDILNN